MSYIIEITVTTHFRNIIIPHSGCFPLRRYAESLSVGFHGVSKVSLLKLIHAIIVSAHILLLFFLVSSLVIRWGCQFLLLYVAALSVPNEILLNNVAADCQK